MNCEIGFFLALTSLYSLQLSVIFVPFGLTSLCLSVEFSGGHRVRLDVRNIVQFSLFPGQVGALFDGVCVIHSCRMISLIWELTFLGDHCGRPKSQWALPSGFSHYRCHANLKLGT